MTEKAASSYKTYTFSLTREISDDIDKLTTVAQRVNRSHVVKAGLKALRGLEESEQKALLEGVIAKQR